ncbi:MAG: type II toxin-antitoxin system HicB family antitoxin [Acidobacteria bacterium]|nr:type II toxin-antitoxin system HicB family antitoxin [Acidobacteriota bacterium]
MKLHVMIERDETGYYVAEVPALPGCLSQGKTREEALANVKRAALRSVADQRGQTVPETSVTFSEFS